MVTSASHVRPRARPSFGRLSLLVFLLGLLALGAAPAGAEDEGGGDAAPAAPSEAKPPLPGTRQGPGVGREQMWPAPTAEDWAKPVLIEFQRTWEDAVAVSEETGKPILICINMDGEIASEHYAGVRYRQPEVAALYEPYVCVIASVYRHNPRDHDDEGNRILCPRFGSVTCGEHIAIEPVIYEKYCDGRRIAPRHICVDLDHEEVYDVYYVNDTAGVFEAIRDGNDDLPPPKPPIVRGDRPIVERVASRHVADRQAVEEAYREGDEALRKRLVEAAAKHPEAAPLDLLRLAIFGLDVDLSRQAREALTQTESPQATPLISEALQVPMEPEEKDALIATLKRLGENSTLARWLAGVHGGLVRPSGAVDPEAWAKGAGGTYPAPRPDADSLTWEVERLARAAEAAPEDAEAQLALAEANLTLAQRAPETYMTNPRLARRVAEQLYGEAAAAAERAHQLGADGWRVHTVLSLAAYYTGDLETAYAHAEKAMADLPPGEPAWRAMAVVTVFAESRWKAIKAAVQAKEDWPGSWLADLHAAYAALQAHPLGTADQVLWHYEFLVWLGAEHRAGRVLQKGLERFGTSEVLHQRLRERLLRRRGPDDLERAYKHMMDEQAEAPAVALFGGLASVAAAEHHRRTRAWEEARAAYGRAIDRYEAAASRDEAYDDVVKAAVSLALAGRARTAYQLDDLDAAHRDIMASFMKSPTSAGTRDGMGVTPGETAQMLLARLREADRQDLVHELEAALGSLDAELLAPDIGLGPGGR